MSVVITAPRYFSDRAKEMLGTIGEVNAQLFTPDGLLAAVKTCRVLCIRVETLVTKEVIDAAPDLKVVLSGTTGTNHIDMDALKARGIPLFHLHGEHTRPTAELAMTLLLTTARNIRPAHAALERGEWDRHRFIGRELKGLKLGIVGLGKIGSEVCMLANGFGMVVSAVDPAVSAEQMEAKGATKVDGVKALFAQSDAITLHLPLTAESRNLIDADCIAALSDGSYLINAARGGIVDEEALVAEIRKGRIFAAVDVFEVEPPGADHLLAVCARECTNLILSPHLGASTLQAVERSSCKLAVDALNHLGLPVPN